MIDKLAEQEIFDTSTNLLNGQMKQGFKLKGMSHPRMDFKAFKSNEK